MVMRDENCSVNGFARGRGQPIAENPQTSATIQDQSAAIRSDQLETRRVSTIAPRGPVHRRGRSTHAPEAEFGNLICHNFGITWDRAVKFLLGRALAGNPSKTQG